MLLLSMCFVCIFDPHVLFLRNNAEAAPKAPEVDLAAKVEEQKKKEKKKSPCNLL